MTNIVPRAIPAALLTLLLTAAPAQAAQDDRRQELRTDRAAAERALTDVQRLLRGEGVRTGRELTPALAELARRTPALRPADRRAARAVGLRPTDPGDEDEYASPSVFTCSTSFCFHWVDTAADDDAPDLSDDDGEDDGDGVPDYIELMTASFERVHDVENDAMGWLPALPDADGPDDRTDVYVANIGDKAFGYASPEVAGTSRANPAYLVMDDDYSAAEFPPYGGAPEAPIQVTAAHEYNHVLQFRYDTYQDSWMFESTATWMEDKVFPAVDDYLFYLPSWAQQPALPMTRFNPGPDPGEEGDKVYGSAVWNHWLDGRFSADAIRNAWEVSGNPGQGLPPDFAPGAYDVAIRSRGGAGFSQEFVDFAATTAEWRAANSGFDDFAAFPEMARTTSGGQLLTLPVNGGAVTGRLDHTGFALFAVAPSNAAALQLTGGLPAGTAGGIALIGLANGSMSKVVGQLPAGGQTTVTLPNPGAFSRVTAMIANADFGVTGYDNPPQDPPDWNWARDDQDVSLQVSDGTGAGGTPPPPPPPAPPPPAATATLRLGSGTLPRLARLARRGVLAITARVTGPGRLRAKATVDKATAKRLKVGRKKKTIGTGALSVKKAGKATVKIKLTKKARAGLKRQRLTLRILVRVTFTPAGGGRAVTKKLSVLLRP